MTTTVQIAVVLMIVSAVVAGVGLFLRRRMRLARHFGNDRLAERLLGPGAARIPWLRAALAVSAALALGIALMVPRPGGPPARGAGRAVVLVIDVSTSMLAEDEAPSRLGWTRAAAGRLVEALGDVPMGIVVFAGSAHALAPPTLDPAAIQLYLDALDAGMVTQTGTALAAAVRQGVGLLHSGGEGGVLVLFSDGDVGEPDGAVGDAIALARRAGVPILAVGVGSPDGATVPALDPLMGFPAGMLVGEDGLPVRSRLGEAVLREIAEGSDGRYLPAASFDPERLAGTVRLAAGVAEGGAGSGWFAWLAAAGCLLLVIESVMAGAVGRRAIGVAAALLMLAACGPRGGDGAGDGDGPAVDSVALFREFAIARPDDPVPLYGLGTVLLNRGRFEEARLPLDRATRASAPEVRRRAQFNLANSVLEPIHATPPSDDPPERERRAEALRAAAEGYRDVLRSTPADLDAKWNLELTLRRLDEERVPPADPPPPPDDDGPGGGGGGGGQSDPSDAAPDPQPQPGGSGAQAPSLTEEEAESLLAGARDREVGAQRDALRKPQPEGVIAH